VAAGVEGSRLWFSSSSSSSSDPSSSVTEKEERGGGRGAGGRGGDAEEGAVEEDEEAEVLDEATGGLKPQPVLYDMALFGRVCCGLGTYLERRGFD